MIHRYWLIIELCIYYVPKVYLLQQGKKIHKKKTSVKKGEESPIFNEAIIFNVPSHILQVSNNF